jgi:hypothetical protein
MRARASSAPDAEPEPPALWAPAPRATQPPGRHHGSHDRHDAAETALIAAIGSVRTRADASESAERPELADGPASVAERRIRPRGRTGKRERLRQIRSLWPLLPILTVQALLAWRSIGTNTAFLDEATYMWSGRISADHFIHGTSVPQFQTYFSGAPVLYPVLAAVAGKLGGLTGARLLSLGFMLLATTAIHLTGRRMHGATAGFFAAAVFAALGPTLHLSSFATFDAMALSLLAWSTYFTVRFAYGDSRNALLYGAVCMVLADCVKYASLLWNPVIILLAACAGPGFAAWRCSRAWNLQRFAMVSTTLLALALLTGRESYFTGFDHTTLQRTASNTSTSAIVDGVGQWIGPLLGCAALGTILALWQWRRGSLTRLQAATMALLLAASLLAPANQLRIHTIVSLNKHVDFGASFAAIAAGYLLDQIVRAVSPKRSKSRVPRAVVTTALALATLVPLNLTGDHLANSLQEAWPNSAGLVSALQPLVHKGNDQYLVEDYDVPAYYLPHINYWQWHDTFSGTWHDPTTGATITGIPAFQSAIRAHTYKLIVLDYADTATVDDAITGTITKAGYRKIARIPSNDTVSKVVYTVWQSP